MNPIHSFFSNVDHNAKMPGDGYLPNLDVGQHVVALARYNVKPSSMNNGRVIVEADFMVLESNVHKPGEMRGQAWFPGTDQYGLSDGRTKDFILKVGQCIGDNRDLTSIGVDMATGQKARGVVLRVMVTPAKTKDGKDRFNAKTGKQTLNCTWTPIQQTPEQIVEMRKRLDQVCPLPAPGQAPQQPQNGGGQWGGNQQPSPGGGQWGGNPNAGQWGGNQNAGGGGQWGGPQQNPNAGGGGGQWGGNQQPQGGGGQWGGNPNAGGVQQNQNTGGNPQWGGSPTGPGPGSTTTWGNGGGNGNNQGSW